MSANRIVCVEVNMINRGEPGKHCLAVWISRVNSKPTLYLDNHYHAPTHQARRLMRGIHMLAAFARRNLQAQIDFEATACPCLVRRK